MSEAVEIVEVGPRDGLQNEKAILPTATKVAYIRKAIDAGLRRIEAVSFAHPARVPQMADAEQVMALVPREPGVVYAGLVLNRRGLDRALSAGVDEINYVVVASDEFSRRNQGMSVVESLRQWEWIVPDARAAGLRVTLTVAAAFGCPFTGPVDPGRVRALIADAFGGASGAFGGASGDAIAGAASADEICLADTIGAGRPSQVPALVAAAREAAPGVPLRAHFHNTRNTGYANAVAAVAAGVSALDASLGGIGGCPFAPAATGNIATEDLAYLLGAGDIDVKSAAEAGQWIGTQLGITVPAQLGRAGLPW